MGYSEGEEAEEEGCYGCSAESSLKSALPAKAKRPESAASSFPQEWFESAADERTPADRSRVSGSISRRRRLKYIYLHKAVELTPPRMRIGNCVKVCLRNLTGSGEECQEQHLSQVEKTELSRKMFSALQARSLRVSKVMKAFQQDHRSIIQHKPPKDKIGPVSAFAIGVFAVTLLAPAGWILHHIPHYRQRTSAQHRNCGAPCN
ncbi:uncharacterized protein LOC133487540 isoform X2 [Phyllopteryx taeniolatus]|uniref:uncharacterized protein LOC133487540 isoform X2 n=1 Tax=Phyllopteryx taeniolatus TaxID=161469 RepID=UPI002AD3B27F|nr:uncharacterized protein LOC133487540 isoform X2 [Phyllopteryx taeniolatus]